MTEEESRILYELQQKLNDIQLQVTQTHEQHQELYQAFLGTPLGASKDTKHLLARLRAMVDNFDKLSWAGRMLAWGIPLVSGTVGGFIVWLKGI